MNKHKHILFKSIAAIVFIISISPFVMIFWLANCLKNGEYLPGRDTAAYWNDGIVEITRCAGYHRYDIEINGEKYVLSDVKNVKYMIVDDSLLLLCDGIRIIVNLDSGEYVMGAYSIEHSEYAAYFENADNFKAVK